MRKVTLILSILFALSTPAEISAQVSLTITGVSNNRGVIQLAVWPSQDGFPENYKKAVLLKTLSLDELGDIIKLNELGEGIYAIAIYHDENEDVVLNRNVFGIPKEGFGFSKNPKIRFGPPKFNEAAFRVSGDTSLKIKINYP